MFDRLKPLTYLIETLRPNYQSSSWPAQRFQPFMHYRHAHSRDPFGGAVENARKLRRSRGSSKSAIRRVNRQKIIKAS